MLLELGALVAVAAVMAGGIALSARDTFGPIMLFTLLSIPMVVVRPLIIFFLPGAGGQVHEFTERPTEAVAWAMLLFVLSYVAFVVGYIARPRLARQVAASLPAPAREPVYPRLRLLTGLLVLLTILVTLTLMAAAGGPAALVDQARHGLFEGRAVLQELPLLAMYFGVLLLLQAQRQRRSIVVPVAFLTVGAVATLAYGDRTGLYLPLMAYMIGYHYSIRKLPVTRFVTVALVAAAGLIVLGFVRTAIFTGTEFDSASLIEGQTGQMETIATSMTTGLNLENFDRLAIVVQDFGPGNLRLGEDFWLGLINLVPRALWPDKPDVLRPGGWFTATYTPVKEGGQPFLVQGDWYINFGLPGVVAGFFASGFLMRVIRGYQERLGFVPWVNLLYTMVVFSLTSWGVLHAGTAVEVALFLVPFAFAIFVLTRPTGRPTPPLRPAVTGET